MNESESYEAAFAELKEILQNLQDPQTSLDELAAGMKRANTLIEFCKTKLRVLETTLEEFQSNKKGHDPSGS